MPIVPPFGLPPPLPAGPNQRGNNAGPTGPISPASNPAGGQNFPIDGSLSMGKPWGGPAAPLTSGALAPWQRQLPGIYLQTQTKPIQLAAGESRLILDKPDGIRVFLQVRSARTSDGVVGIGFGNELPPDGGAQGGLQICDYELEPGEAFSFNGDGFVPQDLIYVRASTTGGDPIFIIVTWSEIAQ